MKSYIKVISAIVTDDNGNEHEIKRVGAWVSIEAKGDDADRLAAALEAKAKQIRLHGITE